MKEGRQEGMQTGSYEKMKEGRQEGMQTGKYEKIKKRRQVDIKIGTERQEDMRNKGRKIG